jgi:hypothetical protein
MSQQLSINPAVQIVNDPFLYMYGLVQEYVNTTTLAVGNGQCRDITNAFDIVSNTVLTVSTSFVGAGGLDTGIVAANTFYGVFIVFDPTNTIPPAIVLSTNYNGSPILPSVNGTTYGAYRLIGYWLTDGSSNFVSGNVRGLGSLNYFQYDAPIVVLNAGTSSSANVSLASAIPSSGRVDRVTINAAYAPHAAGEFATVKPFGNTNALYTLPGLVAGVTQANLIEIVPGFSSGVLTLTYGLSVTTSPASLSLSVLGYEFSL